MSKIEGKGTSESPQFLIYQSEDGTTRVELEPGAVVRLFRTTATDGKQYTVSNQLAKAHPPVSVRESAALQQVTTL